MRILAGDIGATNSRLAIFDYDDVGLKLIVHKTYSSGEYSCLSDVVSGFLEFVGGACEALCLGLPGPVHSDALIRLTNLPWCVDREQLRISAHTDQVLLINDVEASASGIAELNADALVCLHEGCADPQGHRAVISIGTGLGVGGLTASGRAFATEAGHATFSPQNDFDFGFFSDLRREFGHVSWERVVSGPALPRIYSYLAPPDAPMLGAQDIVGRSISDESCEKTVATFRRYIGAAAGNIALTLMATGGIYFAGGVAPRVIDETGVAPILDAFFAKGRMRSLLERMPVFLVRDDHLALKGAARSAVTRFAGPGHGGGAAG